MEFHLRWRYRWICWDLDRRRFIVITEPILLSRMLKEENPLKDIIFFENSAYSNITICHFHHADTDNQFKSKLPALLWMKSQMPEYIDQMHFHQILLKLTPRESHRKVSIYDNIDACFTAGKIIIYGAQFSRQVTTSKRGYLHILSPRLVWTTMRAFFLFKNMRVIVLYSNHTRWSPGH